MVSLSANPMAHPPRSNPFLRSSSDAPPFPCITPSTVTCVMVVSFMIAVPFSLGAPLVGGLSPLLRTPLPRSDTASRISFEDFVAVVSRSDSDPIARRFRGDCAPLPHVRVQCGRALLGAEMLRSVALPIGLLLAVLIITSTQPDPISGRAAPNLSPIRVGVRRSSPPRPSLPRGWSYTSMRRRINECG